ncbi:MAG TPA: enoyl-CoA hydratase/isomerase family protein [Candidatus Angelobacter sp.]|nr:enoyl-CoA hydratase/isomerase family protein [Candidatus Angelobacter sp.]
MSEELLKEFREGVLWLTIHRPERRNALNEPVVRGLLETLSDANKNREIRAIVLTGSGEQAFCAGADLQAGGSFVFDYSEPYLGYANLLRCARACTVPLIARVNGACMAGGMGLLAVCDIAVAASHAKFGLPEVKVGVFPMQVLSVLQHLVPRRVLTQMCLTGEPMDAPAALAAGLVNVVTDALDEGVEKILKPILSNSPTAIRRGLYTMKRLEAMPFEEAIAFTEGQIGLLALTEDAREGTRAFAEKRPPKWTGK